MAFLHRLERIFGRFAIPNLTLYLIVGQVVIFTFAMFGRPELMRLIALLPIEVQHGQVWRLVTFLFMPPVNPASLSAVGAVFLAFGWYVFWMMGSALEQHWGVFRYNLFILVGWLLTVAVAFLFPLTFATNMYLAGSVFLAFAFLNPNFEMMLFFILPIKIKWLALVAWLGYGYTLAVGGWSDRMAILAAVGNFLLFFAGEIVQRVRTGRRRMEHQTRVAAAKTVAEREPRHRCVVCGKNDLTHPLEDFRYSDDDQCYCAEHRPKPAAPSGT